PPRTSSGKPAVAPPTSSPGSSLSSTSPLKSSKAKEKIEEVADANTQVSYSVIDGETASFYKNFTAAMKVEASSGGGSLVKWCVEYEKVNEEIPEPDIIKETAVATFYAYLTKNY
ncbi:Pathogenesis-related protein Bet v I family, partial [Musa troglodytarum]